MQSTRASLKAESRRRHSHPCASLRLHEFGRVWTLNKIKQSRIDIPVPDKNNCAKEGEQRSTTTRSEEECGATTTATDWGDNAQGGGPQLRLRRIWHRRDPVALPTCGDPDAPMPRSFHRDSGGSYRQQSLRRIERAQVVKPRSPMESKLPLARRRDLHPRRNLSSGKPRLLLQRKSSLRQHAKTQEINVSGVEGKIPVNLRVWLACV